MTITRYRKNGTWIDSPSWVRPADWLALPALSASDNKVVGLVAVFPHDSNYLALTCAGDYTVDWGDGTAPENVASGIQANHQYTYASISSSTECSRGYRQCIVTVTPQGATWTTVNLGVRHSSLTVNQTTSWLDVTVAGSTIAALTVTATIAVPRFMERFTAVGPSAVTSMASVFLNCTALVTVTMPNFTATVTNMTSMFSGCRSLRTVALDTAAVTNMTSMFLNCAALQTVPLFNTAAVTNMTTMFSGCSSLTIVPLFNTAVVTDMTAMFNTCTALQTVPLFNTAAVTNMTSMFTSCTALQTVPLFNTAAVTTMSGMFGNCAALQTVPLFNTAAVTSMATMFNGCTALQTVPLFNTAAVTNMSGMFTTCSALTTVPLFNTAAVTNMGSMFATCTVLPALPLFNTAAVTSMATMFAGCGALSVGALAGTNTSISYASCRLSAANLDLIYTNLSATGAGKTITVTGNPGTSGDTPSIATAKGWTVTGS